MCLYIWGMGGIALLYGLSMLLAFVFSRRFTRSTEALSTITKDIGILHMTQKVVYSLLERVPANVE